MKLGATITSERGKAVTKTGNDELKIEIKDENRGIVFEINVTLDSNTTKPKMTVWHDPYCVVESYVDAELSKNGNLKHGKCRCNDCIESEPPYR